MKLETLQRSIKQWIIGPTLSSQDLLCVRDALGGPHLDAEKQIGIYRTQYIRHRRENRCGNGRVIRGFKRSTHGIVQESRILDDGLHALGSKRC